MAWYPQVRECCGLGEKGLPHVGARLDLCVGGWDGPDAEHGPCGRRVGLDPLGQAEHGQSEVVAHPARGDFGQGVAGASSPGWRTPLRTLCGL